MQESPPAVAALRSGLIIHRGFGTLPRRFHGIHGRAWSSVFHLTAVAIHPGNEHVRHFRKVAEVDSLRKHSPWLVRWPVLHVRWTLANKASAGGTRTRMRRDAVGEQFELYDRDRQVSLYITITPQIP